MFGIWKWELCLILSTAMGIFIIVRTKNITIRAKFIWIVAVLIFNIFAILAFLIWKKKNYPIDLSRTNKNKFNC